MAATVESMLACGAAKAFAQSLLGRRALGCGDNIPSVADVVWDDRLEWASPGGWRGRFFFFRD